MVATARIVSQKLEADSVLTAFADGSVEHRPYKFNPNLDQDMIDMGCSGTYVDMFPVENVIPDMVLAKFTER